MSSSKVIYMGLIGYQKHGFRVLNPDLTLGKQLTFRRKLFKKGGIGSLYTIRQGETPGEYTFTQEQAPELIEKEEHLYTPSYFFSKEIEEWKLTHRIQSTLETKVDQRKFDLPLAEMRAYSRTLSKAQRSAFLVYIIESIT